MSDRILQEPTNQSNAKSTPLLVTYQVQSTLHHVPKVIVSIREEKNDTTIESLPLIRIPSLCNMFTSRTLSKMIQFGICKGQNDLSHPAQHAEPPGGHIWSHFD